MRFPLAAVLVAPLLFTVLGCSGDEDDSGENPLGNRPPSVTAPGASALTVASGTAVFLQVTAFDPDGDALKYSWVQSPASPAGTFSNPASASPTWTSPQVSTAQDFTLTVTVSDGRGASLPGSITIRVNPPVPLNQAPVLDAAPTASSGTVATGGSLTLSVTASDADGDALTYAWSQVSPNTPEGSFGSPTAASTTWAAPSVGSDLAVTLRVTVSDGRGGSVQGNVNVTVLAAAPQNTAPVVAADITGPASFSAGTKQAFSITASDADGDSLTYTWSQVAGATGTFVGATNQPTVEWYSPQLAAQGSATLSVSVTDGKSPPETRTLVVTVDVPAFSQVQSLFDAQCTGCHGGGGGLDLSPANSHANLVNVTASSTGCTTLSLVTPGDPAQSVLVLKMEGTTCGSRMPISNPAYFTDNPWDVVLVRSWIAAGAANN